MLNVNKDTITDHVIAALSKDIPDRNRQIMTSLIRHMHAFCKEVDLTFAEWFAACEFLRRAGDISDEKRNEFILIADILGVEVLVDMLDHRVTDGESESTVLGPFYRENPPVLPKAPRSSRRRSTTRRPSRSRGASAIPRDGRSRVSPSTSGKTRRMDSMICRIRSSRPTICADAS